MSSSLGFGSHIKALSTGNAPSDPYSAIAPSVNTPDDAYNIVGQHTGPEPRASDLEYPAEEAAQLLLETVLSSLGTVQHLLDPRSFSDRLASAREIGTRQRPRSLWDIEYLLVFAIGELLQGVIPEDSVLPGTRYFQEAVSQLPGFLTLRAAGTVAVEIMGLAAFYLQCADCKEDAYVYVSAILIQYVENTCLYEATRRGWG